MSTIQACAPEAHMDRIYVNERVVEWRGCWVWTGSTDARGYATCTRRSQSRRVHRLSFEAFRGSIPEGLVLDHLCHDADESCAGGPSCPHRACVNPWHLEPVTHWTNTLRGRGNVAKTACPKGHPYTAGWGGRRVCRPCHRDDLRAYSERRKAV